MLIKNSEAIFNDIKEKRMPEVVGVRFHGMGKSYDFAKNGFEVGTGDAVVVETSKGLQLGICADHGKFRRDDQLFGTLLPILRIANDDDLAQYEQNNVDEGEAFRICRDKIVEFGLEMSLVDTEYTLDRQKLLFYFTADDRVDFRSFVRELASIFRCRIELRQIGVRDEAMMSGGLGICGRELCCASWLNEFIPVSVKMAKTQSLSMNPTKISGSCGRLMCCLKFEQDHYLDTKRVAPKTGAVVTSPRGDANVVDVNYLTEAVTVRLEGDDSDDLYRYQIDELEYNRPARKKIPQVKQQSAFDELPAAETKSPSACGCNKAEDGGCCKTKKVLPNLSEDDESYVVGGHPGMPSSQSTESPTGQLTESPSGLLTESPTRGAAVLSVCEAVGVSNDGQTTAENKELTQSSRGPKPKRRRLGRPAEPGFIPHMISPSDLEEE